MIRSGKREVACTGVMGKPDELDARITSAGSMESSRRNRFSLMSDRSGPFSCTKSQPLAAVSRSASKTSRALYEAKFSQNGPMCGDFLAQVRLCTGCGVRGAHIESLGEK